MPEQPDNIVPITPDARTAAEKFSAEHDRELLTILFTDLVDSTKLQSEAGNVEAARLTELHRKIVRDELAKYDAREIEWAGDSCLAVFTKPSDAVVFALRMQAEHRRVRELEPKLLKVRVGMHLGEIVVKKRSDGGKKTEDLFGLQVSEAARVMSVARGNQVFCTRAVFDNARSALKGRAIEGVGEAVWVNYGAFLLKGSEDPIELCEIGSADVAVLKAPETNEKVAPVLPGGVEAMRALIPYEATETQAGVPRWTIAAAAVVAVILTLFASRFIAPDRTRKTNSDTPIRSLAVLPFDNLMGDDAKEYFVDGMTDTLTAELSKIGSIKVIARTSAMKFKNSDVPLSDIARQLGVDGLIEGSVQQFGEEIRITAQLIHGASEEHQWGDNFEGTLAGVMKMQGEVAIAIADQIGAVLTPEERDLYASAKDLNPEAYDLYLQGQSAFRRRTEPDLLQAIEFYTRALQLDSTYALAHAGIADIHSIGYGYRMASFEDSQETAFEHARLAIESDPTLAEAHTALGMAYTNFAHDQYLALAKQSLQRALELNPNLPEARRLYGFILAIMGQVAEGLRETRSALELNPLDPLSIALMSEVLKMGERFVEAEAANLRAIEIDPDLLFPQLTLQTLLWRIGRLEEARDRANDYAERTANPVAVAFAQRAEAAVQGTDALQSVLADQASNDLLGLSGMGPHVANLYFTVGDVDGALDSLRDDVRSRRMGAAVARGRDRIHNIVSDEEERLFLDDDPRFWEMLDEYDLPPLAPEHPLYEAEQDWRTQKAAEAALAAQPKPVRRYSINLDPRFPIATSELGVPESIRVSPDGDKIYYISDAGGVHRIMVRALSSFDSEPIRGSEGASAISLSPDGSRFAFEAKGAIWILPVDGGVARRANGFPFIRLAPPPIWLDNESLATFCLPGSPFRAFNVDSEVFTELSSTTATAPMLPTSIDRANRILIVAEANLNLEITSHVLNIDSGELKVLAEGDIASIFPTGHVILSRLSDSFSSPRLSEFDRDRLALTGKQIPLTEDTSAPKLVGSSYSAKGDMFSALPSSPITQSSSQLSLTSSQRTLVWVDLEGKELPLDLRPMGYRKVRVFGSGTEQRIAVDLQDESDVWIVEADASLRRFTFGLPRNQNPIWSPDGKEIFFGAIADPFPGNAYRLYRKPADLSGELTMLPGEAALTPYTWGPDGESLIGVTPNSNGVDVSISALHLNDEARTELLVTSTEHGFATPALSPDGRWLAYGSDETGEGNIFVRSWPDLRVLGQLSEQGGREPLWAADSSTLYYRGPTHVMGVSIRPTAAFAWDPPTEVFEDKYFRITTASDPRSYDFDPVANRFLMVKEPQVRGSTEILVIENYFEEVKARFERIREAN